MRMSVFTRRTLESTTAEINTWLAGVELRYLTVGGATVDVYELTRGEGHTGPYVRRAALCSGCHQDGGREFPVLRDAAPGAVGHEVEATDRTTRYARDWAQEHAETCRALPKPTA